MKHRCVIDSLIAIMLGLALGATCFAPGLFAEEGGSKPDAAEVVDLSPPGENPGDGRNKNQTPPTQTDLHDKKAEQIEAARLLADAIRKAKEDHELHQAEAKKKEDEAQRLEAARKKAAEEQAKIAEAKRAEEDARKKAEATRIAEEEIKRVVAEEQAKIAQAKRAEEARKKAEGEAEAARLAEEAKKKAAAEEQARLAEAKRVEDETKKKADAEESARVAALKKEEVDAKRSAEAKKKEMEEQQARFLAETKRLEELARKKEEEAEAAKLADQKKKDEIAKTAETARTVDTTIKADNVSANPSPVKNDEVPDQIDKKNLVAEAIPAKKPDEDGGLKAEPVPLPAQGPAPTDETRNRRVDAPENLDSVALALDNANSIVRGEPIRLNLFGPETFLRAASAHFVLRDELGRVLEERNFKVVDLPFSEGKPRQLNVALNIPLARQHTLTLSLIGPDARTVERSLSFSVPPAIGDPWDHWIAMTSTPPASGNWAPLNALGIRGGLQYRLNQNRREALRKGNAPFYVENVSRQLLSRYYTEPGLWEKTIAAMGTPGNRKALFREPSLCSPQFAESFAHELQKHAEVYSADPPLFYSLASEPSTTRLSAAVDFDFSPASMAEFQRWLERDVYGTLKTLNAEWNTKFNSWQEVVPMTTDEARMRMHDGAMNFAPWVDFRDFQDQVFSNVLHDGSDFVRQFDKNAKVGITGAMGPFAFGGWDWSRLSRSLDVVECYDIGGARALWRDLAPGKPAIAILALPKDGDSQFALTELTRTAWSLALEGGPRGILLWDESGTALVNSDGNPSTLAQALSPTLKALDADAGAILAHSSRVNDGVAILYSPASVRVQWLLEADKLKGDKWLSEWGADTSAERRESIQLRLRESWGKLLDDMGLSWRFISSNQVEKREILKAGSNIKTIVLPRTVALSDEEAAVLKEFVHQGGRLIADSSCGRFNEHGHLRKQPALDEVFEVDTSGEPFFAERMNPLERVRPMERLDVGTTGSPNEEDSALGREAMTRESILTDENLRDMAPIFSDKPRWVGRNRIGAEYRGSPVLATTPKSVYLNLDVSNYLRWRLHPDQPQARVTREIIARFAFKDRLAESPIDWKKTHLPEGAQLIWMQAGASSAPRMLVIRANPQTRLHELGADGDNNGIFDRAQPFTIVLKAPAWVNPLRAGPRAPFDPLRQDALQPTGKEAVQQFSGTLDPYVPSIFTLGAAQAAVPVVEAAKNARPGDPVEIKIKSVAGETAEHIYAVRVTAPDGTERPWYGTTKHSTAAKFSHVIPFALNDAPGIWQITLRDLSAGSEAQFSVELHGR